MSGPVDSFGAGRVMGSARRWVAARPYRPRISDFLAWNSSSLRMPSSRNCELPDLFSRIKRRSRTGRCASLNEVVLHLLADRIELGLMRAGKDHRVVVGPSGRQSATQLISTRLREVDEAVGKAAGGLHLHGRDLTECDSLIALRVSQAAEAFALDDEPVAVDVNLPVVALGLHERPEI